MAAVKPIHPTSCFNVGHTTENNKQFLKAMLYSNFLILPLGEGAHIRLKEPLIYISEEFYLDKFKHRTTESLLKEHYMLLTS